MLSTMNYCSIALGYSFFRATISISLLTPCLGATLRWGTISSPQQRTVKSGVPKPWQTGVSNARISWETVNRP